MRKLCLAAVLMLPLLASPGQAGGVLDTLRMQGNDTGGIIAWSPDIAYVYRDMAAAHCLAYNKVAEITSVHPWYGDYVAFRCHFPAGYDPSKWMLLGRPVSVLN